jgi:hypothetical protein
LVLRAPKLLLKLLVRSAAAIKEAKSCLKVFIAEALHNATAAAPVNRRQRTPD